MFYLLNVVRYDCGYCYSKALRRCRRRCHWELENVPGIVILVPLNMVDSCCPSFYFIFFIFKSFLFSIFHQALVMTLMVKMLLKQQVC